MVPALAMTVSDRAGRSTEPAGAASRHLSGPGPAVVTIAALYGAGDTEIGARVAEQLGVPLFDRAIIDEVARRTGLPEEAVSAIDEQPRSLSRRVFDRIGRASTITGEGAERLDVDERELRARIEELLAGISTLGGVIIGRGGMVVLRSVPWVLHVHLTGPVEARITRAMDTEGIDRRAAEQRQKRQDRARIDYVRAAYDIDGRDVRLYHLVLDSTSLDLEVCVDLIVRASQARSRHPRPTPPI
jgi:cytidylate kinase